MLLQLPLVPQAVPPNVGMGGPGLGAVCWAEAQVLGAMGTG